MDHFGRMVIYEHVMKVLKMFDDSLGTVSLCLVLPVRNKNHTPLMLIIPEAARVHALVVLLERSMALRRYATRQRGLRGSHSQCRSGLWDHSCLGIWMIVPSRTVASDRACSAAEDLRLVSSCQKLQDTTAPRLILAADSLLILSE